MSIVSDEIDFYSENPIEYPEGLANSDYTEIISHSNVLASSHPSLGLLSAKDALKASLVHQERLSNKEYFKTLQKVTYQISMAIQQGKVKTSIQVLFLDSANKLKDVLVEQQYKCSTKTAHNGFELEIFWGQTK